MDTQVFYYEDSAQGKTLAELIQTELNTRLEVESAPFPERE